MFQLLQFGQQASLPGWAALSAGIASRQTAGWPVSARSSCLSQLHQSLSKSHPCNLVVARCKSLQAGRIFLTASATDILLHHRSRLRPPQ